MTRIVIDKDIPFIRDLFEPFFSEVIYAAGSAIEPSMVRDAQALIVRTRTRVDERLLYGSAVRFVATATIGTDHIDLNYCLSHNITVRSAAGCNARAVAQWVFAALNHLGRKGGTIGIIGVGNVGREVEAMALERSFSVLRNDPPRAMVEEGFVDIKHLLSNSDIITLHTPLDSTTRGMISSDFLAQIKPGAVLLNSSRGEVIDEETLLDYSGTYCLDVWSGEPFINVKLMERAAIATPHVAGYSARGKARASEMCVRAAAQFFGIEDLNEWNISSTYPLETPDEYDIMIDDRALRSAPENFERIRRIRDIATATPYFVPTGTREI